jgi:hypothetical protein
MKNVKDKIWWQIFDQACNQIESQVWDQVNFQIVDSMWQICRRIRSKL